MRVNLNGNYWYIVSNNEPHDLKKRIEEMKDNEFNIFESPDISQGSTDIINSIKNFSNFMADVKEDGLFYAIYGKSFFNVVKDFLKDLLIDILDFILGNADLFFIAPAIVIMFVTFIIGKNKYTKYIIPLWFLYFIGTFLHKIVVFE